MLKRENLIEIYPFGSFSHKDDFFSVDGFEKKGSRRPILEAITTIINRVTKGHKTVSIVMPPRQGKSNVIRLAAMELLHQGLVSACLNFVPWVNLSEQLADQGKVDEMMRFYPPTGRHPFGAMTVLEFTPNFHQRQSPGGKPIHLYTATTGLVFHNLSNLIRWVRLCLATTGLPPIVFIDEAHLLSELKAWGEMAQIIQEHGGIIVLLTGTAVREDGTQIPGFEIVPLNKSQIIKKTYEDHLENPKLYWEILSSHLKVAYVLEADYEMPLFRAYSLGTLLKTRVHWIDAYCALRNDFEIGLTIISDDELDDDNEKKRIISPDDVDLVASIDDLEYVPFNTLPAYKQTKHLRSASLHEKTIERGLTEMLQEWDASRKRTLDNGRTYPNKNVKFMIVSMSDNQGYSTDGLQNIHPKKILRILNKVARKLKITLGDDNLSVPIATGANDPKEKAEGIAHKRLKEFKELKHDGIIVKGMGVVGLDIKELKFMLFLTVNRTIALWLQTILRTATVWNECTSTWATVYLLRDDQNEKNFKHLVADHGGEDLIDDQALVLDAGSALSKTLKERKEGEDPPLEKLDVNEVNADDISSTEKSGLTLSKKEVEVINWYIEFVDKSATDAAILVWFSALLKMFGQTWEDEFFAKMKADMAAREPFQMTGLNGDPQENQKAQSTLFQDMVDDKEILAYISKCFKERNHPPMYDHLPESRETVLILAKELETLVKLYATYKVHYRNQSWKLNKTTEEISAAWQEAKSKLSGELRSKFNWARKIPEEPNTDKLKPAIDIAKGRIWTLLQQ